MIEDCSDLLQCENRLSKEVLDIDLLGQIALSPEDLDLLGILIRQRISPNISEGTRFLERQAPTCLACFLVWTGIVGYQDGDYWSAVRESTGLVEDPNWERRWGRIFLDFLETNDLPRFDIEGGLTYVTPLLTHGGIPNSCLSEYFEKVLLPLIQRDLIDPTDLEEIIHELAILREDNRERLGAEHRYSDLQKEVLSLAKEARRAHRVVGTYDKVTSLWRAEKDAKALDLPTDLPADYEAFKTRKCKEIRRLEEGIRDLEERRAHYEQVLTRFTEQDEQVLAQAEAIERSIAAHPMLKEQQQTVNSLATEEEGLAERLSSQSTEILSAPWNDEHGELVTQLPFDRLREEIGRFEVIVSRQAELQRTLDRPRASPEAMLWRIGRILVVPVSLLLGVMLAVIGLYVLRSWALVVAGVGFTILIAGFASWFWHRSTTKRRGQSEALKQTSRETTSTREEVQRNIARILSDLPVAERQLRSPSPELHHALVSLAGAYRELCEVRQRRVQLQQQIRQQAQHIEKVAVSIGLQPTRNLISAMDRALKEARERQAASARAINELENNVQPEIAALSARQEVIHEDVARIEKRLIELGGGDIQAGIRQVEEQRQRQARGTKLRVELKEEYPDLAAIERQIRSARRSGRDKNALQVQARQLTEQLEKARAQADRVKQELSYYPAVFPGVDEPIRRYLLYGGKPAEEFLVRSVSLAHPALTEEKIPDAHEIGLPERVVTAFEHRWPQYVAEVGRRAQLDERQTTTGQRFRAPSISIDPAMAEITVYFYAQRYLASIGGTDAHLEVVESPPGSRCQTFPLRVYRRTEDLLETQELEFPLAFPADRYEFSLRSDSGVINRWEVPPMRSDAPCMVFEGRSGRLIKDEELPSGEVWFVSKDALLEPAECILERGSLHGRWKGYSFLKLDLGDVDELQVTDDQGQHFLIPISSEMVPALDLIGGERLEGVSSDGVEVYVGPPPRIRVPIEDKAELRLWRISIFPDEESSLQDRKHYRLSELWETLDVRIDEGWVDVPLTNKMLLSQRPVGRFTIRVRKPPYTDWRSTFCVVPFLEVTFDRDVYLPYETERAPDVRARISTAKAAEFVPQPPAKLYETTDNLYVVRVDGREDYLRGTLCFRSPEGGGQRIPLAISIPKVKWRLQGLEDDQRAVWCDTIEELWLGDWETVPELFLVVALPSFVDGCLRLSLDGKEEERDLCEGKARFNLLAFVDALRAGPSVQIFGLTLRRLRFGIEHVPLFRVRTRWEVEDVECVQESRGRIIILNVTWTEKGRTGNKTKIIRLWSTSDMLARPTIEQRVLEDIQRATLQASERRLLPGTYLVQITLEDPWSTTEISRPTQDAPNTQVIEIVPQLPPGFHPQAWGKKGKAIACVQLTPTKGGFLINGEPLENYFSIDQKPCFTKLGTGNFRTVTRRDIAIEPFEKLGLDPKDFTVNAYVEGGNQEEGKRQPRAIAHAVAGALSLLDNSWRPPLIRGGFRFRFDPPEWVKKDHPRLLALSKRSKSSGNHDELP